jgi:hypothetical protein
LRAGAWRLTFINIWNHKSTVHSRQSVPSTPTLTTHVPKIRLNCILPSTSWIYKWLLSKYIHFQNYVHIFVFTNLASFHSHNNTGRPL